MTKFKNSVVRVVNTVPFGKVVSYGQVALYLGIPRAAQQVGWTLNRLEGVESLPWWRVVSNQGRISIKGSRYSAEDQRRLLVKEGVEVNEDLAFDIEKYRYIPDSSMLEELGLDPFYISSISKKLPYSSYFPQQK
jgi:methylated-DNA-protein-cysteine methyltransferase-like protein